MLREQCEPETPARSAKLRAIPPEAPSSSAVLVRSACLTNTQFAGNRSDVSKLCARPTERSDSVRTGDLAGFQSVI